MPDPSLPKLIIAVSAFETDGIKADRADLLRGFRRELIANLVRFREWAVRDGNPASSKPGSMTIPEKYVVHASARQETRAVRLTVTLRDTGAGEDVWSDQYRLTVDDWNDAQQHLVERIASVVSARLANDRLAVVGDRSGEPSTAYDRWLYGQSKTSLWSPAAFHEATAIFERIIADTPDFSPAYSTLAQLQNSVHFIHPGVYRSRRRTAQALAYARVASRLDPADSRGHLSLGWAYAMTGQHDLAETHHRLAADLNANDPWTTTSVALGFAFRGQDTLARRVAERALALTPGLGPQHWGYHQQVRFITGDYQGSVEASEGAGDVIPTAPAWRIAALGHLGYRQEARHEGRLYLARIRGKWFGYEPATTASIVRWVLHCFPIKRTEDWRNFRDGLAEADLPVSGLAHDTW